MTSTPHVTRKTHQPQMPVCRGGARSRRLPRTHPSPPHRRGARLRAPLRAKARPPRGLARLPRTSLALLLGYPRFPPPFGRRCVAWRLLRLAPQGCSIRTPTPRPARCRSRASLRSQVRGYPPLLARCRCLRFRPFASS